MLQQPELAFSIDHWAQQQPSKIAIYTEERSISYHDLYERASLLAGTLLERGFTAQDRILLFLPNTIEYVIAFYAAAKLSLNITPASPHCKVTELAQMIQIIQPKLALVAEASKAELLRSVDPSLPVMHISADTPLPAEPAPRVDGFPKDLTAACVYVATSGSTGHLKFVSNTYRNELINAHLYLERLGITREDVLLTELPTTHKFGMAAMLGNCLIGSTMVMTSRFDANATLSLIEKHRVTVQYGVPTMYIKEKNAFTLAAEKPDLSSLRVGIIAGSAGSSDIFRWFDEELNCQLLNCYGTTEIGGLTMVKYQSPAVARYQTCGPVFPGAVIEIMDQNGHPLPQGERGEIVCSVPWAMNGYVNEPELTAAAFDHRRWFLTGDIGYLDQEGNLIISGRKKDLIIRGGYNVFPAEVEQALLKHPDILEVCVMGHQDPCLGESICAFIRPKNGTIPDRSEIRRQTEAHIAKYKLPDHLLFLEEIPRLSNGKYNRPILSKMLAGKLQAI